MQKSLGFNKVYRVIFYFHFLFYKLFLQKQLFTGDFQSKCSEKLSKSNRKTPAMETFFCEVGDCNLTIKGLYEKFFRAYFDKFSSFLKNNYRRMILFLLGFYEILPVF